MREIKFRGKRTDNGEWVVGDYSRYSKEKSIIMVDLLEQEDYWVWSATVGQYTGLKDKNGIEIYEGDILQYFNPCNEKHNIGIVKWEPQFAGFSLFKDDNDKYAHESDWLKIQGLTIIGNIHDNPTEGEE